MEHPFCWLLWQNHGVNYDCCRPKPIASQHFNLSGLYEFSEDRAEIDVDAVVAMMEEILDTTVENESDQIKSK